MGTIGIVSRFIVLGAMAAFFAGCAGQQVKGERRFFWPPLPERPRLEWVKSYSSQHDFPKVGFASFLAQIAGEDEAITLSKPLDIKSDSAGRVYVTDPGAAAVFVYDLNQRNVHVLGGDNAIDQFRQPVGVAVDDVGNVYVSEAEKGIIIVYDRDEKPLRVIETRPHLLRNGDIVFDRARKRLVLADIRGHKVAFFGPEGGFQGSFGGRGEGEGKLNFPVAVAVNSTGEIIVADSMNARIQIFDSEGKFLRMFGERGDGPADFQIIKGVAVDSEDNIYVTDGKGHKISIYSPKGDYLLTVGGLFSALTTGKEAPGGFVIPQGIDIDRNDIVYVVDQLNRRFQVFQYISDDFLGKHPIPGFQPR